MKGVQRFLGGGAVELGVKIINVVFHCEAADMLVIVPLEVDPCV